MDDPDISPRKPLGPGQEQLLQYLAKFGPVSEERMTPATQARAEGLAARGLARRNSQAMWFSTAAGNKLVYGG